MMHPIECHCCGSLLLRKSHDGNMRLSGKVVVFDPSGTEMMVVCKGCNQETVLPYELTLRKSYAEPPKEPESFYRIVKSNKESVPPIVIRRKKSAS